MRQSPLGGVVVHLQAPRSGGGGGREKTGGGCTRLCFQNCAPKKWAPLCGCAGVTSPPLSPDRGLISCHWKWWAGAFCWGATWQTETAYHCQRLEDNNTTGPNSRQRSRGGWLPLVRNTTTTGSWRMANTPTTSALDLAAFNHQRDHQPRAPAGAGAGLSASWCRQVGPWSARVRSWELVGSGSWAPGPRRRRLRGRQGGAGRTAHLAVPIITRGGRRG